MVHYTRCVIPHIPRCITVIRGFYVVTVAGGINQNVLIDLSYNMFKLSNTACDILLTSYCNL